MTVSSEEAEQAAQRLMSLELRSEESGSEEAEPEGLDELMQDISSTNAKQRLSGLQQLRRRASDGCEASYQRLLRSPAMDAIVESLGSQSNAELQLEASWALTNLLSSGRGHADAVLASGAVQQLLRLLAAGNEPKLQEQACWAVCNLVGESPHHRDAVIEAGLLPALLALWDSKPIGDVLDAASLVLVGIFRDREPRCSYDVARSLLPRMQQLLDAEQSGIVPNVLWAMSYLVEESETRISLLLEADGLVRRLRDLLLPTTDVGALVPTLRIFGNISAGCDLLPGCVLADGLLARMRRLLRHEESKIRRQILFFVGNVSDGPDSHLRQIVDAGLLADVGGILESCGESERREAFWVVPNFCISRAASFKNLIIQHCLEGFLQMLQLQDTELTQCILMTVRELLYAARYTCKSDMDFEALKAKIEHCGGLKKIELVQKMDDADLVKMSYQIIDHFFWGNEKKYMNSEDVGQMLEGNIGDEAAEKDAEKPMQSVERECAGNEGGEVPGDGSTG